MTETLNPNKRVEFVRSHIEGGGGPCPCCGQATETIRVREIHRDYGKITVKRQWDECEDCGNTDGR